MAGSEQLAGEGRRLVSLDALRGADMFLLVGITGIVRALPEISDHPFFSDLSEQFRHPPWHGFTLYDLIFPLFIFIVGAAMPFSFARRLERGDRRWGLFGHVLARTILLTILGLIYWGTSGGAHPTYGYYSVLYRIGISYFFAAIILMNLRPVGWAICALILIIGYEAALQFVPVPQHGAGNFTKEGCLPTYVAEQVSLAISPKFAYVLSITLIPTVATALFGALAGEWLRSNRGPGRKTVGLLLWGAIFLGVALFTPNLVPINKHLWSTSFTLLTAGISFVLLGLAYWMIDVRGWRRPAFFFVVVGMNPIVIYLAERLIDFRKLANVFVGEYMEALGTAGPLVNAITAAALMWLFLYFLYVNKAFLRI